MTILYSLSHIYKSLQWQWFAEEMQKRGVSQVYVLIENIKTKDRDHNFFYEDLIKLGIPVYKLSHLNWLSYLVNIFKMVVIIRRHRVKLVHSSLPLGNFVGQNAARLAGVKRRITTCENASWAHDFNSRKQEIVDRITYRLANKVVATADAAGEYLRQHYKISDKKLLTIYHGLKESEYQEVSPERVQRLRESLNIGNGEFIVGVVSRYEFWKGHAYINQAAAILKKRNQHQNIRFLIFGSKGSYYETAMKQIRELDVADMVHYKGFIGDPVALFRVFDVHLHVPVSKYVENGGINIIEGMISGRPQILTKSGYAWQSAEHMKNAYVVDYENAEEIANAIIYLKNNPEICKKISEQARQDAIATYGLKTKADKYLELYRQA